MEAEATAAETNPNPTTEDSTPQDSTPQDSVAEDSTLQNPTPQDSAAAEDSTPQNPTPQDSAAQDSTPQDPAPQEEISMETEPTNDTEESKGEEEAPPEADPEPPKDEVYEKYWAAVKANPLDFNTWVKLLAHVEKKADLDVAAPVFDAFLAEFPLTFGYWCKLADLRYKLGLDPETKEVDDATDREVVAVYERGAAAARHSMEMWHKYGAYMAEKRQHDPEETRKVYERAAAAVGADPKAAPLWRKWVKFELAQAAPARAAAVYARALAHRLSDLDAVWEELREFAAAPRAVKDFVPDADYQALRDKVAERKREAAEAAAEARRQAREKAAEARAAAAAENPDLAPGGGVSDDEEEGAPGAAALPDPQVSEEEVRAEYLAQREAEYLVTKAEVAKRAEFEAVIKRPYFHVKALDDRQLQNWREYLQFEEQESRADPAAVRQLYERCLVACANYSEFWARYARWLEGAPAPVGGAEASHGAAHRACATFLKYRPDAHLFYADLLESHGHPGQARQVYRNVTATVAAGLVEAFVRFANFERRQGDLKAAAAVYEALLDAHPAPPAAAEGAAPAPAAAAASGAARPFVVLHYARFQAKVLGDPAAARATLAAARAAQPDRGELALAALQLEMEQRDEEKVDAVFEGLAAAEGAQLGPEDLAEAWQLYLEYKEDFGAKVADVRRARARHEQFLAEAAPGGSPGPSGTGSLKRPAPAGGAGGGPAAKRPSHHHPGHGGAPAAAAPAPAAAAAGYPPHPSQAAYPDPSYQAHYAAQQHHHHGHPPPAAAGGYPAAQYSYPQHY